MSGTWPAQEYWTVYTIQAVASLLALALCLFLARQLRTETSPAWRFFLRCIIAFFLAGMLALWFFPPSP